MNESLILTNLLNNCTSGDLAFILEVLLMITSFMYFWYLVLTNSTPKIFMSNMYQNCASGFWKANVQVSNGKLVSRYEKPKRRSYHGANTRALNNFSKKRLYMGIVNKQKNTLEVFHAKNESLKVGSII